MRPVGPVELVDAIWLTVGERRVLRLSSDTIELEIAPDRGADLLSLRYLPTGDQVMWRHPGHVTEFSGQTRPERTDESEFYDNYPGGMQELFPNVGPACVVAGTALPFHGEACRIPWNTRVERTGNNITVFCETSLGQYPFTLERRLSIADASPVLSIESTITNTSSDPLPVLWAFHPAFGDAITAGPSRLYADMENVTSHDGRLAGVRRFGAGDRVPFKKIGFDNVGELDLNKPDDHSGDLLYATCNSGWFALRNDQSGLTVGMSWPIGIFPYLWIWQECHNPVNYPWWGQHHIVGIEPNSAIPMTGLADAIAASTALVAEPNKPVTADLTMSIMVIPPNSGGPVGVGADGRILTELAKQHY